jgi:TatD DNase family protein
MPEILAKMAENKVTHALCVSVDLPDFPSVLALAEQYPHIYASVGVHPDYEDTPEPSVAQLVELAQHPKIIAIGETGLDYYRLGERSVAEMAWQRDRFRVHIRAARASARPLVVHTRSASVDTLALLREEGGGAVGGVFHCFTESAEVARAALDLGFFISFSGILTFRNAHELREVARLVPMDRLLIETDSPYLAPVPHRGRTNQPAYVVHVAEQVAAIKAIPLQAVAAATSQNFERLFGVES